MGQSKAEKITGTKTDAVVNRKGQGSYAERIKTQVIPTNVGVSITSMRQTKVRDLLVELGREEKVDDLVKDIKKCAGNDIDTKVLIEKNRIKIIQAIEGTTSISEVTATLLQAMNSELKETDIEIMAFIRPLAGRGSQ